VKWLAAFAAGAYGGKWPISAVPLSHFRVCFQGYSSRASCELTGQLMTHSDTSPPSISALRNDHSITRTVVTSEPTHEEPVAFRFLPVSFGNPHFMLIAF
jgi:hypothetical protein